MAKKVFVRFVGLVLAVCFCITVKNVNFKTIYNLSENTPITISNLDVLNKEKSFGEYVKANIVEDVWQTGSGKEKKTSLIVKLFGFIPIKKTVVTICKDKNVYIGGVPLGFSITTKGVMVVGKNKVIGEEKELEKTLKVGDILTKINNIDIFNVKDIQKELKNYKSGKLDITFLRDGKVKTGKLTPIFDEEYKEYKLGIWIKNDAQGVGTLTFVTENSGYGALGHAITDFETGAQIPVKDGKIYPCTILGITKGKKGKAGELRCLFVEGSQNKGNIEKNTKCGVFGKIEKIDSVVDKNLSYPIASRFIVKPGKAKIVSSISGIREEYDIEIIKTYNQKSSSGKSFIFRVKDKRLLNLTGGIVQGMSGSPIIQDGKLIGAVTHVMLYDPTKGYGVYSDWMLDEVS